MHKLIFGLVVLLTFNNVKAIDKCISKLTDNYTLDSRAFHINTDHVDFNSHENDYMAQGIELIRVVLEENDCDGDRDINFGHGPNGRTKHSCQYLIPGKQTSSACYIESNIGFFFVTRDLQTSAHIIFNRWD